MGLFSLFCVRHLRWTAEEDLTLRIEMPRRPAEFAPGFVAAEPLVVRVAPGPFAEFGRDGVRRDDLRRFVPGQMVPREGAGDPADRQAFDRSPDIAFAGGAAFQRQCIEL